jgi:SAM-dependent methyltransferase
MSVREGVGVVFTPFSPDSGSDTAPSDGSPRTAFKVSQPQDLCPEWGRREYRCWVQFEVASEAYEAFMGRWSRLLAGPFAEFAGVGDGMRVLDVGCGTGALTDELLARLPDSSVTAVDPSVSFVAAVAARLPGIEVSRAAAERLPFAENAFDAAVAQLVVHFMADPVAGLAEMRRVTRRGGVVAACVWDYAGGRGPLGVFWDAARATRPDAPDESALAGTKEGHLARLFHAAGLGRVTATSLSVTIAHPTFADWWAPFTRGAGPAGAYVATLDPDDRETLMAECRRRLPATPIVVSASAWAVRGVA